MCNNIIIVLIAMLFSYIASDTAQEDNLGETNSSSMAKVPSCGNDAVLVSNNRTLAPLELVQASNSLDRIQASATRIYDSILTWCTDNDDPDPYIDLQFTSPILISMMMSTGTILPDGRRPRLGVYYITTFTLEYSPPDSSSMLKYYTSTDESATPEYFTVPDFITLIQFKRPFLTQRIRLRPVDWFDSDGDAYPVQYLCQGVALYGCLQSQGRNSDTIQSNSKTMDLEREYHSTITLAALGIGAALAGALLTIAVIGIVCCCRQIRKRRLLMREDSTIANNIAYSITDKHENIELQDNKCYKSIQIPTAELNSSSATPHEHNRESS